MEFAWEDEWYFDRSPAWADEQGLPEPDTGLWEKADGEQIAVADMTSHHIYNCITRLENNIDDVYTEAWIQIFRNELRRRTVSDFE